MDFVHADHIARSLAKEFDVGGIGGRHHFNLVIVGAVGPLQLDDVEGVFIDARLYLYRPQQIAPLAKPYPKRSVRIGAAPSSPGWNPGTSLDASHAEGPSMADAERKRKLDGK